jgi:predicted alpha/beta-hydrolase family hydrolase
MKPKPEHFQIPVEAPKIESISAIWHDCRTSNARPESPILLANGAGFHMGAPWMQTLALGLVEQGFSVLRFNYPYKELSLQLEKMQPPNRMPVLEAAHERALAALVERSGVQRPILAGKSLGARVSSHLAARDCPAKGLVYFGYPLHPPKQPEKIRHEHFPAIVQPSLFLGGTRDPLAPLESLRSSLKSYGGLAELEVIDDADHGFHVRKSSARTDSEVLQQLILRVARWDDERFGA